MEYLEGLFPIESVRALLAAGAGAVFVLVSGLIRDSVAAGRAEKVRKDEAARKKADHDDELERVAKAEEQSREAERQRVGRERAQRVLEQSQRHGEKVLEVMSTFDTRLHYQPSREAMRPFLAEIPLIPNEAVRSAAHDTNTILTLAAMLPEPKRRGLEMQLHAAGSLNAVLGSYIREEPIPQDSVDSLGRDALALLNELELDLR